jgi:hypothetical protein
MTGYPEDHGFEVLGTGCSGDYMDLRESVTG